MIGNYSMLYFEEAFGGYQEAHIILTLSACLGVFGFGFFIAEGQQLPAVLTGPSAAHRLPIVVRRALSARPQTHAHGLEAGEYPVRRLGL